MLPFFLLASLLVLLALALLLVVLLRKYDAPELANTANRTPALDATSPLSGRELANTRIAREQLAALDASHQAGDISDAQYAAEREAVERELASGLEAGKPKIERDGRLSAAIMIAVALPLGTGVLYQLLGNPTAIEAGDQLAIESTATDLQTQADARAAAAGLPPMSELIPELKRKLAEQPDDIEGRRLLVRAQMTVGDTAGAKGTLEEIIALEENDIPALLGLAELIATERQGNLAGEPMAYLQKILAVDPEQPAALWMSAIGYQQSGQHERAIANFTTLLPLLEGDSEAQQAINDTANQSRAALGLPPETLTVEGAAEPLVSNPGTVTAPSASNADQTAAATDTPRVEVSVTLSESARASVDNNQAVFIYARAAEGPPMPLAVSRHTVAELPLTVTLDADMAMLPDMSIETFNDIVVGARVSATGDAIAQAGDWMAESAVVKADEQPVVSLEINQQVP